MFGSDDCSSYSNSLDNDSYRDNCVTLAPIFLGLKISLLTLTNASFDYFRGEVVRVDFAFINGTRVNSSL